MSILLGILIALVAVCFILLITGYLNDNVELLFASGFFGIMFSLCFGAVLLINYKINQQPKLESSRYYDMKIQYIKVNDSTFKADTLFIQQ